MKTSLILLFLYLSTFLSAQATLKVGTVAPDIALKGRDGQVVRLSENRGSLTIVHFWASWSEACKPMNQFLTQSYSKYRKEGLEIFSISIDKKARSWLEGVDEQKLNWPNHVSDFKGMVYSKPAKDYKIYEVPSVFLLDESGVIIMVNPTQEELAKRLKLLDTELKLLPKKSSNLVFFTKRVDYSIYDSTDTLVLGGKGQMIRVNSLDTGYYRVEADDKRFSFLKVNQDKIYDFQINYKTKQVTFSTACNYELRSKNGNLLFSSQGEYFDYSVLKLNHKDDYYLVLPNSAHAVKLY